MLPGLGCSGRCGWRSTLTGNRPGPGLCLCTVGRNQVRFRGVGRFAGAVKRQTHRGVQRRCGSPKGLAGQPAKEAAHAITRAR